MAPDGNEWLALESDSSATRRAPRHSLNRRRLSGRFGGGKGHRFSRKSKTD